jgi:hypothetical protein
MVHRAGARTYAPRMRDIETIDSELRLLLAIRQMVREEEGRPAVVRADRRTARRARHVSSRA